MGERRREWEREVGRGREREKGTVAVNYHLMTKNDVILAKILCTCRADFLLAESRDL